jgi:hypothetical protein
MPRTESADEKKYIVDTPVNPQYFVFLNKLSKDEDLVFVARVVKEDGEEMRVEYFPQSTDQIQMMMWTNWQLDEREQSSTSGCGLARRSRIEASTRGRRTRGVV